MSDFTFYLELGLLHVLDIKAYDHMLFLVALTVPFSFKKFKTVFWIVTFFTFGHTFSLFMSAYEIYRPNETLIETLILIFENILKKQDKFILSKSHASFPLCILLVRKYSQKDLSCRQI